MTRTGMLFRAAAMALPLCLALAAPSLAQKQKGAAPAGAPVIGVVDVRKVLTSANAAQGIHKSVEAKRKEFEAELERQKTELQQAEEQLRRQQTILAPDAMQQKRADLERQVSEVRRQTQQRRELLTQVFNDAMRRLRVEVQKSVGAVMQARGVTLALPRSAVLIFDEQLNITEEVIEHLNGRIPEVRVEFGPVPQGTTN